ncbi:Uncharacterised protein [Mycobacteroides abscessus subsp. abscessus]|nr:Uncharacterised protein [Mycobacteroides abscessus subsp. abscessus]
MTETGNGGVLDWTMNTNAASSAMSQAASPSRYQGTCWWYP